MWARVAISVWLALCFSKGLLAVELPAPSAFGEHDFLYDYADVISRATVLGIETTQARIFRELQIPIVVVTIDRMKDYGYGGTSLTEFARHWFDEWKIGSVRGPNRGILLLVSVGDRMVRIELGADWGHSRDYYCQQIVDHQLLPHFREGDYADGIAMAVESLAAMARADPSDTSSLPDIEPHKPFWQSRLPMDLAIGAILVGAFMISVSLYWERHELPYWSEFEPISKVLLVFGIILVLLGVIGMVVLLALTYLLRIWLELGTDDAGDSGFGGGFSGGGGAGGSW